MKYANTFIEFTGLFEQQEPLIRLWNFVLGRLCIVLLGQIVFVDDVGHSLVIGFEGIGSTAEVYLEQALCSERILRVRKHIKAALLYLLVKCHVNNEFF